MSSSEMAKKAALNEDLTKFSDVYRVHEELGSDPDTEQMLLGQVRLLLEGEVQARVSHGTKFQKFHFYLLDNFLIMALPSRDDEDVLPHVWYGSSREEDSKKKSEGEVDGYTNEADEDAIERRGTDGW